MYKWLLLFFSLCLNAQIYVSWNQNTEPDLAGYIVHVGTTSGSYVQSQDNGLSNRYIYNTDIPGTYYFMVTAYDKGGNISDPSNEAFATIEAELDTIPPARVQHVKIGWPDYTVIIDMTAQDIVDAYGQGIKFLGTVDASHTDQTGTLRMYAIVGNLPHVLLAKNLTGSYTIGIQGTLLDNVYIAVNGVAHRWVGVDIPFETNGETLIDVYNTFGDCYLKRLTIKQ